MKTINALVGAIGTALLLSALPLTAGCQGSAPRVAPDRVRVQLEDDDGYRQFWQHAVKSVRDFGYDLDRVDPAAGVITTHRLTSKQWFEFWRTDTVGAEQVLESSLHTIWRRVRVEVRPGDGPDQYLVDATVEVQRESVPERQFTTSATAAEAFDDSLPTVGEPGAGIEGDRYAVDLGRDPTLEAAILERIARYPGATAVPREQNEEATAANQPA